MLQRAPAVIQLRNLRGPQLEVRSGDRRERLGVVCGDSVEDPPVECLVDDEMAEAARTATTATVAAESQLSIAMPNDRPNPRQRRGSGWFGG